MPGKAAVTVASQPCWAQVQMVDMCRALIDKYVQVDAIVCPLDYANHELEVVATKLRHSLLMLIDLLLLVCS
jgi:hypothetical protein